MESLSDTQFVTALVAFVLVLVYMAGSIIADVTWQWRHNRRIRRRLQIESQARESETPSR